MAIHSGTSQDVYVEILYAVYIRISFEIPLTLSLIIVPGFPLRYT